MEQVDAKHRYKATGYELNWAGQNLSMGYRPGEAKAFLVEFGNLTMLFITVLLPWNFHT
jgi:hypothetical protein